MIFNGPRTNIFSSALCIFWLILVLLPNKYNFLWLYRAFTSLFFFVSKNLCCFEFLEIWRKVLRTKILTKVPTEVPTNLEYFSNVLGAKEQQRDYQKYVQRHFFKTIAQRCEVFVKIINRKNKEYSFPTELLRKKYSVRLTRHAKYILEK